MKNKKIKTKKILSLLLITVFFCSFLLLITESVSAVEFKPQITIGKNIIKGQSITINSDSIGQYILAIYNYAIGTVGVIATVVMMYAGILWITAAGNQEQIGKAKDYIASSLTGLVLLLCSWMILWTVNPDLTSFKPIAPTPVGEAPDLTQGCCESDSSSPRDTTANNCDTENGETFWSGYYANNNGECVNTVCCIFQNSVNSVPFNDCDDGISFAICQSRVNGIPYNNQKCEKLPKINNFTPVSSKCVNI